MDNKYIMAEEQDFKKMKSFWIYDGNNEGIEYIDITKFVSDKNLTKITDMFSFPGIANNLKGIKLKGNNIYDFELCFSNLKMKSLDLSNFNTSEGIYFSRMFKYSELEEFYFKISSIHSDYFQEMFFGAEVKTFKFELKNSNIQYIDEMFANFKSEKTTLNMDLKNVNSIFGMFRDSNIKELDLSNVYFGNETDMKFMFLRLVSDLLILPDSFPIAFNPHIFRVSKIKEIKTPNEKFYEKHKEWFKNNHGTELILI